MVQGNPSILIHVMHYGRLSDYRRTLKPGSQYVARHRKACDAISCCNEIHVDTKIFDHFMNALNHGNLR